MDAELAKQFTTRIPVAAGDPVEWFEHPVIEVSGVLRGPAGWSVETDEFDDDGLDAIVSVFDEWGDEIVSIDSSGLVDVTPPVAAAHEWLSLRDLRASLDTREVLDHEWIELDETIAAQGMLRGVLALATEPPEIVALLGPVPEPPLAGVWAKAAGHIIGHCEAFDLDLAHLLVCNGRLADDEGPALLALEDGLARVSASLGVGGGRLPRAWNAYERRRGYCRGR